MSALNQQLVANFKKLLPKLSKDLRKGQSGRIGIVGGSKEYTGAPYFSSISSLRSGADLAYIVTCKEAAPVIKSYSPELIVLPILDSENSEEEMKNWMVRIHSLIIGPGLGRDEIAFKSVKTAVKTAISQDIPIVIDADGLFVLSQDTSLISGYEKCILTPNFIEFKRLYDNSFKDEEYEESKVFNTLELQCDAVQRLASVLKNVTIIKKGKVDIISNGRETVCSDAEGSLKRCGGVGDLLTGAIGAFTYWCHSNSQSNETKFNYPLNLIAAYNASILIKESSRRAFKKFRRSTLAVDVIEQIPDTFYDLFDQENY